jgi:hypothetical protein
VGPAPRQQRPAQHLAVEQQTAAASLSLAVVAVFAFMLTFVSVRVFTRAAVR